MPRRHVPFTSALTLALASAPWALSLPFAHGGDEFSPALGKGVNTSETKTYDRCVVYNEADPQAFISETANPSLSRLYNELQIKSREDIHRELGIDAAVSAKGLWGSASGAVSHFSRVDLQSENFYWMVNANYEKSRRMINLAHSSFGLSPRAKEILKRFGIKEFYRACGTHFYSGQKTGAQYTLLYEFETREDKVSERLNASAHYGGFGVKASGSFRNALEMAKQSSRLKIYSHIQGGDDQLSDKASDPEALVSELKILRQQLYSQDKGVVLSWTVNDYDLFPEVIQAKRQATGDYTDYFRTEALRKYFNLYERNRERINTLERRLTLSEGEEPLYIYSAGKVHQLEELVVRYEAQNEKIASKAIECLSSDQQRVCLTSDLVDTPLTLPSPDQDLTGLGNWSILGAVQNGPVFPLLGLVGDPGRGYQNRIFETFDKLLISGGQVYVLARDPDSNAAMMPIGIPKNVLEPTQRIGLCTGIYKDSCTLRVIENPNARLDDGLPLSKVELVVYSSSGLVAHRFQFPIAH